MATRSIRFIDSFRNLKISLLAGKWPQKPLLPSGKWAYPFDILDLLSIFNFRPHLVWTDQESDDEFKSEEDDDDVVDRLDDEHHCWELHIAISVLESCFQMRFGRSRCLDLLQLVSSGDDESEG